MLHLPKRWIRNLTYGTGLFIVALLLIRIANENNIITIPNVLKSSNWLDLDQKIYLIDVSVERCLKLKERCYIKDQAKGHMGQLKNTFWIEDQSDLLLGSSWVYKKYLGMKFLVDPVPVDGKPIDVVVDIAVSNPSVDGKIKNNAKALIPEKVLKDIHMSRVFDENDRIQIEEANKDEVLDGKADPEEIARLKQQQESQAEDFRVSAEKEEAEKKKGEEKIDSSKENGNEEQNPEEPKDTNSKRTLYKRERKADHKSLEGHYLIPNQAMLDKFKWRKSVHGIWLKYGPADENAISWLEPLFGPDAASPYDQATVIKEPLLGVGTKEGFEPRLAYFKSDKGKGYKTPQLRFNKNGKFKILQIADAHFSTGVGKCRDPVPEESAKDCEADPRTLRFIERVLDIEKPDFVVLTGDQIYGEGAPDPRTALYKLVKPLATRKIPFAVVLGNHDDKLTFSREEMINLADGLPYSLTSSGPLEVDGWGNYGLLVKSSKMFKKGAAALYFLDSHGYSTQPKIASGYDWFKDSQILWLESEAKKMEEQMVKEKKLGMAFFHIPIPEYRNLDNQAFIGEHREGITAPRYNSDMRTLFGRANIQVATVGHDHCNDYCLLDIQNSGNEQYESRMWLCYGGAVGEGGYGGYNGYIRRLRVYELDENEGSIKSWKRAENDPDVTFDMQRIVDQGNVVNFAE